MTREMRVAGEWTVQYLFSVGSIIPVHWGRVYYYLVTRIGTFAFPPSFFSTFYVQSRQSDSRFFFSLPHCFSFYVKER